jgi:hypothetical protein
MLFPERDRPRWAPVPRPDISDATLGLLHTVSKRTLAVRVKAVIRLVQHEEAARGRSRVVRTLPDHTLTLILSNPEQIVCRLLLTAAYTAFFRGDTISRPSSYAASAIIEASICR